MDAATAAPASRVGAPCSTTSCHRVAHCGGLSAAPSCTANTQVSGTADEHTPRLRSRQLARAAYLSPQEDAALTRVVGALGRAPYSPHRQKGAPKLSGSRRAFADDPLNLLAVDGPARGAKGDGVAATWLPPEQALPQRTRAKYGLWVTGAERDAKVSWPGWS